MDFMSTVKGSLLEHFYPAGWDMARIDRCTANPPETILDRQLDWHPAFTPVPCATLADFDMMMGHEIALAIRQAREDGVPLALILPVGPMGMYRWVVYFLKAWKTDCAHVHGFNMDEWADGEGNTLPSDDPGAFQNAMLQAFYGPLGDLTVPVGQRNFATHANLPTYPEKIDTLKKAGGRLITVFGIGRMCHIAFWEPHFASEYSTATEWESQPYRLGAQLHPLTIEQNAITSFKSRTTLVPCRANTIGPGLFLQSDQIIGGADGILGRGMMWQGMSLWMTLRYGKDPWVPSTYMPTLPGKLFFMKELAGPLVADCN